MELIGEPVYDEKFKRHYQEVKFTHGDEIPDGAQCKLDKWVVAIVGDEPYQGIQTIPWRIPCDPPVAEPQKLYAGGSMKRLGSGSPTTTHTKILKSRKASLCQGATTMPTASSQNSTSSAPLSVKS